jgi:type VI secretion system secreted protein Hcp
MAIYLKLESIKGSVTVEAFKDQIEFQSFQWGAGLGVTAPRGGSRTSSEPSVSEIVLTKTLDKASEGLFKALLKGEPIGTGTISFTAASAGEAVAYVQVELEKIIVSGYSLSTGGDLPSESLSLNFTKFDWCYTDRDAEQEGSPSHLVYDLESNKVG